MDISKYLKNVKNLEDYTNITQDFQNKYALSKIRLNMTSVLALKNIKTLEIEYFDKKHENGIAVHIFNSLLNLPASKTWALLGKELILMLKYWFDTLRKQIIQCKYWWSFLSILLKIVQEIRTKDGTINNIIIVELSESLLDSATHFELNIKQRHQVIQCFNVCSTESSREIRFALRNNLETYFKKLSTLLPFCGDFGLQYSMLEALMRWLLPRQDPSVRKNAANVWFSSEYSHTAIDIFLKRSWMNFFKDARDFLNAQNEKNDLIISVHCRKLNIGKLGLIYETDKKYWLDFNIGSKCVSLMLELKLLKTLKTEALFSDVLIITAENTNTIQMMMDVSLIKIKFEIIDSKQMYRSEELIGQKDVEIYFSPANANKIHDCLTKIFERKYQLLIDLDKVQTYSSENTCEYSQIENSEDDTKLSVRNTVRRRKHSGVISRPRMPTSVQSPASTVSTSSLALLKEKLSAFPGCRFDREPVSVCALPQLSNVTEVTEIDENQSFNDTFKLRAFGVALRNKTDSDRPTLTTNTTSEIENLSPSNVHDENSISCLLVATIGSADDSIINDTLEKLPKDKEVHTDNIVDLLVQEALQSKRTKKFDERDKDVSEKCVTQKIVEGIENQTSNDKVENEVIKTKEVHTSEESNMDFVEATPCYITTRQEKKDKKRIRLEKSLVNNKENDSEVVEKFFSEHFREVENEGIISPTLAKKINETSSECSEDFDLPVQNDFQPEEFNFNELDILDCLNDLVDQVCEKLKNYTRLVDEDRHLEKENTTMNIIEAGLQNSVVTKNAPKTTKKQGKKKTKKPPAKSTPLKLKFKSISPDTKGGKPNKNKLPIEGVSKMSTIYEADSILEKSKVGDKNSSPEQALTRRKRKLYSPKDDHMISTAKKANLSDSEDEIALSDLKQSRKILKSEATPYKELEQIKKSARRIRNRKSRTEPSLSPRSKRKYDIFNSLRNTIENNDDLKFVDTKGEKSTAIYNFSSDSENSDFKYKSIKISNKEAKPVSSRSRRTKPKTNYSETKPKAKNTNKRNVKSKKKIEASRNDLIDERIRDRVSDNFDTSVIIEPPIKTSDNVQPSIIPPEMEAIEEQVSQVKSRSLRRTKQSKKKDQTIKKGNELEVALNVERKREESVSPLPGLIVEALPTNNERDNSIVALDILKDAYERGSSIGKHLELNTTQNLLSDIEQLNYSPPNFDKIFNVSNFNDGENLRNDNYNIKSNGRTKASKTNYLQEIDSSKNKNSKKRNRKDITPKRAKKVDKKSAKSSTSSGSVKCGFEVIEVTAVIENRSGESIQTLGKSPITGHGDFGEQPPDIKQLSQTIKPRDLEVEYLDQSIKDYHKTLTKETCQLWNTKSPSIRNLSKEDIQSIVNNSPAVSICRLSTREINQWVPPRYNSVFGSDQSSNSSRTSRQRKPKKSSPNPVKKVLKDNKKEIRSSISPIKLLNFKPKSVSEDSYVGKIISIYSKKSVTTDNNHTTYNLRKRKLNDGIHETPKKNKLNYSIKTSSPLISKEGSVENKRVVTRSVVLKSITLDNDSESVATSSVSNWLRKSQEVLYSMPSECFDSFMYRDNIKLIMEKIDTSLMEIHHQTSRKYSQLFVSMQKELKESTEHRYQLYKATASEIVVETIELIDKKFQELDNRCKEFDEKMRLDFKEKSHILLHEDMKQKQQFVDLLKQDILSTLLKK